MSYRRTHVTSFLYDEPDRIAAFVEAARSASRAPSANSRPSRSPIGAHTVTATFSEPDAIELQPCGHRFDGRTGELVGG